MVRTAVATLLLALAASTLAASTLAAAGARAEDDPPGETLRVGVPAGPDATAGFDRSLFAEAAREAGLGVVFDVRSPEAALVDLDAGLLDVAAGPYPPAAAAGRRPLEPVVRDGDALLKRRGDASLKAPGDMAGKVLGALGPPAEAPRLRAEATGFGARLAPSRAFPDPLRDLAAGRRAALIGPLRDVAAAALARPDAFEVAGPAFGRTVPLAPLIRADRPALAARLGMALARIAADGRLAELQRRWFGTAFNPSAVQPVSTAKP